MNPSEVFHEDLKFGDKLEHYVLATIQEQYPDAFKIQGYFKPYDILVPHINTSIEVKGDYESNRTNNYLIEVSFAGKPSALSTTEADFWVIIDGHHMIWITPQQIKQCIQAFNVPSRTLTGRGDDKSKEAHLVRRDYIKAHATQVDPIPPDAAIHKDNINHQ